MSHLPLSFVFMNRLNQTESAVFKLWMLYFQRISFSDWFDHVLLLNKVKYLGVTIAVHQRREILAMDLVGYVDNFTLVGDTDNFRSHFLKEPRQLRHEWTRPTRKSLTASTLVTVHISQPPPPTHRHTEVHIRKQRQFAGTCPLVCTVRGSISLLMSLIL